MRVKMQRKEDKKVNNPFKRAVVIFVSAVVCMCLVITALVVYVDPFFHYHEPLKNFPYLVDNQLTQNPGMAEHMDGCDRQVLMDMAWEECAHAKHLCRMMKEHGVDTASHEDTLRKVKETFLK